ncbi:acyltransferase [Acidaminobacter hydrogenoformans]|uniref:Surface polysaccharide O-acyltransferase, integral membrane enzyme n=1 Tax=Acidaminobacter hydrogenoformans DSM 2784 TaxID=1120920 RepID=A0A1G5RYL7_9FIRM|nr:acyltransferase [Acidaminobacter hydrogenoformans]SCZ79096.1 Surface polysaccharide O-acyltransferase, integral membrane enzyme [Acidaminobacter hydrogenoformans DSM 2784]
MSGLHVVKKPAPGERERSPALDLLKIVACVLVVVIHTTASGVTGYLPGSWLQRLAIGVNSFSQFAVPAFIFASGFGLAARYRGKEQVEGLLGFWGRRIETVLLPYLIWSLIYLILQQRFLGICYGAAGMVKLILNGGAFYHLYFMVILIQLYLVFPLLLALRRRFGGGLWDKARPEGDRGFAFSFDIAIVAVLYLLYAFWLRRYVPSSDRFFMTYLPFFYAGMVAFERPPRATLLTAFGIAGAVAFADYLVGRLAVFKSITPMTMLSMPLAWEVYSLSIVMLLLAWFKAVNINEKLGGWVSRLSGVTFDVYLAHPLILFFISRWSRAANLQSLTLEIVLGFVLGLTVPALVRLGYNEVEERFKKRKKEEDKG